MNLLLAVVVSLGLHLSVLLTSPWGEFELDAPTDVIDDLPPAQVQLRAQLAATPKAVTAPAKVARRAVPRPALPPVATAPPPEPLPEPVPPEPDPEPPLPVPAPALAEAPPAAPVKLPLPAFGEARYGVTRGDRGFVVGRAELRWSIDGEHYEASSVIETTGLAALVRDAKVTQVSRGRIDGGGLRPEEFRSEQPKRALVAKIDRAAGKVRNGEREAPLGEWAGNVQDLLSMILQLRLLLQQPQLPESLDLPIATGRKLALYRINVVGREGVHIAGRDYEAVRVAARNAEDLIEFWFAPTTLEVPLRIRFTDRGGDVYEETLESIVREDHS